LSVGISSEPVEQADALERRGATRPENGLPSGVEGPKPQLAPRPRLLASRSELVQETLLESNCRLFFGS
jgi:hypothetical protein